MTASPTLAVIPSRIRGFDISQFCDEPDVCYPVPEFDSDFRDAPELEEIGTMLVERHRDRFGWLDEYGTIIRWLFKAKGGKSAGQPTLGKTVKLSGMVRFYADCDVVVWLAADHLTTESFSNRQVEALVFRQLCAIGCELDEDTGEFRGLSIAPPDLSVYGAEIEAYGLWRLEMRPAAREIARQLRLIGDDAE